MRPEIALQMPNIKSCFRPMRRTSKHSLSPSIHASSTILLEDQPWVGVADLYDDVLHVIREEQVKECNLLVEFNLSVELITVAEEH